ncbi:hypothetical protein CRE_24090 [Caenorhabditis remanei]|uniref:Uncharacterized protein n=1 Tax=Caenorhabditis remanei TaxID=31234 RepID=E3MVI9_CAERE|nr:hypothetical protein CRE_24090 [Caenorhabditis remanei]
MNLHHRNALKFLLSSGPVGDNLMEIGAGNRRRLCKKTKKIPANAPGNSPLENKKSYNNAKSPSSVPGLETLIPTTKITCSTRNTSVNTLSFSVWDTCRLINNWRNNTSLLLVSIQHLMTFNSIMKTQIPTADGIAM